MLISIIIPCYNAEKWIVETLESVFYQSGDYLKEVIVINDGSTDKSEEIIKSDFPDVNIIKTNNQGPSVARNIGTQESSGEFLQYLDADDLLADGKLKKQFDLLAKTKADVAYGNWQKLRKNENNNYIKSEVVRKELENPEIELIGTFWCPPAVYLFRRSIVEKVGGWNEDLPIIQDARFVLDCALHGGKFAYYNEVMAYYRIHGSDSVSKKDSAGFVRDCYINACQVEEWWKKNGGLTEERIKALEHCLGYVTRASYNDDRETFSDAYTKLINLNKDYIPKSGTTTDRFLLATKILGYKNALFLSKYFKKMKKPL